jgi:gluconate kinase
VIVGAGSNLAGCTDCHPYEASQNWFTASLLLEFLIACPAEAFRFFCLTARSGLGKSTIGRCVARRLRAAEVPHALVDHEWLTYCWPGLPSDVWNERLATQNLASVWSNFAAAGAQRLVYCRVLEARSLLRHVATAVPGAVVTVVLLRTPIELIEQRLRAREPNPDWYLDAAKHLVPRLDPSNVADFVVANDRRVPDDVAGEVLDLTQWSR